MADDLSNLLHTASRARTDGYDAALHQTFSQDLAVAAGTVLVAVAIAAFAFSRDPRLTGAAMVVSGVGWIVVLSSLNVSVQTFAPSWVRARTLSVYMLVFQGGTALGSAFWGVVSGRVGTVPALGLAALGLVLGLVTALRWRLRTGDDLDLSPSAHWPEPAVVIEPDPEEGPVLVTIEYRIAPDRAREFDLVMRKLGRSRRCESAIRWGVFRDVADPECYLQAFVVRSWVEHLRQHERVSAATRELEEHALAFHIGEEPPVISHLISGAPTER